MISCDRFSQKCPNLRNKISISIWDFQKIVILFYQFIVQVLSILFFFDYNRALIALRWSPGLGWTLFVIKSAFFWKLWYFVIKKAHFLKKCVVLWYTRKLMCCDKTLKNQYHTSTELNRCKCTHMGTCFREYVNLRGGSIQKQTHMYPRTKWKIEKSSVNIVWKTRTTTQSFFKVNQS